MRNPAVIYTATLLLLIALAGESQAATRDGYSGANLNIRSGPSTRFPAVRRLAAGSALTIHGCVANYKWCDVSASGVRGWVSGAHVQFVHDARRVYVPAYAAQSQIPVVTFNIGSYWRDNYRDYGFYGDIDRWNAHHWEDDGNPPGWRDNWDDDHSAPENEAAFDHEPGPDPSFRPDDEPPPDHE
ncbi:SH3 domain-containing protein [Rhodopseudomonas palustris]|uniref:SH3-like region n=1 Tax=Rhodopseudomonas palustris (strain BisB18) TaxID=316056 RepID=Q214A5_RHOPB